MQEKILIPKTAPLPSFDRRNWLTHSALALGGLAFGGGVLSQVGVVGQALAKPPLTNLPPNLGVHRFSHGAFQITALHDGSFTRELDATFVKNAPLEEVQKVLETHFMPKDKLTISFTALLVNTGTKLVLLDAGFADNGAESSGLVPQALKQAGIDPSMIDVVLISHFHADHLQGLRYKNGDLVYPNAVIMVPEEEWNFWMDEGKEAASPRGMKAAFASVKRVLQPNMQDIVRFKWGQEVVTGITALEAAGHTPGHTAFAISSNGQNMLYVADITNTPVLFATHPEWQVMFDMDAEKAVTTRKRFLDMATKDRLSLSFYHANFPANGFISREGGGYRFHARQWI